MNATPPPGEFRNGSAMRDPDVEKMDQIRELLVGEHVRSNEARMAAMEARLREIETGLIQRLDAMASKRWPERPRAIAARRSTTSREASSTSASAFGASPRTKCAPPQGSRARKDRHVAECCPAQSLAVRR